MIVNTVEKTVQPQGEDIGELLSKLEEMFPNGQWAEYKIAASIVYINNNYPIVPYVPIYPSIPTYPAPWYDHMRITCGTSSGTNVLGPGLTTEYLT